MDSQDKVNMAFTTHLGLFEWNVMPFGLCNALTTFSSVSWYQSFPYLDDTVAHHLLILQWAWQLYWYICLRAANLKMKPKKCELFIFTQPHQRWKHCMHGRSTWDLTKEGLLGDSQATLSVCEWLQQTSCASESLWKHWLRIIALNLYSTFSKVQKCFTIIIEIYKSIINKTQQ